jgi:phosphoglycolate phosphatase-like HAD superfamily hydrolase
LWSRTVVFDLHQVLVNWLDRYVEFVNAQMGYSITTGKQPFYYLHMNPEVPLTFEEHVALFDAFARRHEGGYGDLEIYDGVIEGIKTLRKAGIGVRVWTWTPGAIESTMSHRDRMMSSGAAQAVTRELVAKLGIDPDRELRFITPGSKKFELVEEHYPLIVEDSPETAVGVGQLAHAAILVPEPYNKGIKATNVLRLDHREQLFPTVLKFFEELEAAGKLL